MIHDTPEGQTQYESETPAGGHAEREGLANGYDLRDGPITKLPLERKANSNQFYTKNRFPWISCAPFVENSRGVLIHRPRSAATFNLHKHPHIGVSFWCGMAVSSDGKNLTFLAAPPDGRILCARCESAAIENGLPSADDIAGRHVHKGRTTAVATCCNLAGNETP